MFLKSQIIWHLSQFENQANTPVEFRRDIANMAADTGCMPSAKDFAKQHKDPELGAFYLILEICKIDLRNIKVSAPGAVDPSYYLEMANLLMRAIEIIQANAPLAEGIGQVVADARAIHSEIVHCGQASHISRALASRGKPI